MGGDFFPLFREIFEYTTLHGSQKWMALVESGLCIRLVGWFAV